MDEMNGVRPLLGTAQRPAVSSARPESVPGGADRPARQTFAQALAELVEEAGASAQVAHRASQAQGATSLPTAAGPTVLPPADAGEVILGATTPAVFPDSTSESTGSRPGERDAVVVGRASDASILPSTTPGAPPIGVLWTPKVLRGTGAEGPGIGGTDAHVAETLRIKVDYYNNPAKHGIDLNTEARLFLDAVSRGYVPNSPEGLGTLLAYLGMGSFTSDTQVGRPPAMTTYFKQFFAEEAGRTG